MCAVKSWRGSCGVVVGQSLWKASEVNYDPTLPFYIGKHDTLDSAKVVVGFSIALWVLVQPETACCLAAFPAGRSFEDLRHDITTHEPVRPQISHF